MQNAAESVATRTVAVLSLWTASKSSQRTPRASTRTQTGEIRDIRCSVVADGVREYATQQRLGTVLQRIEVAGAKGSEAILVLRELPPGAESGKHTQSDTEIVYILDGSSTLEVAGKPAQTLKAGEAFSTTAGQVHNVINASASAPAKALAFYIAKKGARLEDLSRPAK